MTTSCVATHPGGWSALSELLRGLATRLLRGLILLAAPTGETARRDATDEELMQQWLGGDYRSFDELFSRYAGRLYHLMRRSVHRDEEAHELVQQSFLQLHRARNDWRPEKPLRPWLITIALNLRRQHARSRSRRPEDATDFDERTLPTVAPHDPVRADQARRVRAALRTLPELQAEVIELHWFQGLSFPEVSRVLGASVSAVKVRAHRGYGRLRDTLATA